MSGHPNKIPTWVKELVVIVASVFVGVFVFEQDKFSFVFDLMDGFISYFGIMSSVSLAILAVLMQQFDRKSMEANRAAEIKNAAVDIANEMSVEVWRIVFMLLPILGYFLMTFFDEKNRYGASLLASITFMAIVFSIVLPFKYVNYIKGQMVNVVEKKEDEEIKEDLDSADELLKQIDCMSVPKDEPETDAGEGAKGEESSKES